MNKKLLKFTSILLVAMCLCMSFTACGGDDDDENHKNNGTEQTEEKDDNNTDENTDNKTEEKPATGIENGHTWVDLGLPSGIKWATCNVGAENPWEYGDYFSWGETVPYGKEDYSNLHNYAYSDNSYVKTYFDWDTYKYCNGSSNNSLTKYNISYDFGSVVDSKTILDLEDDAAYANMGNSWRMPTKEEQKELIYNCYWEWNSNYNGKSVAGYIVYKAKDANDKGKKKYSGTSITTAAPYSLSDTHIFLPAAGACHESTLGVLAGEHAVYWSSSLCEVLDDFTGDNGPHCAYNLGFYPSHVDWNDGCGNRDSGRSVRGVIIQKKEN